MRDLIVQTWSNLAANKLRSFLTMFGIIWGVISIVILSAVSEGFQRGNQKVLREFGKNIVIIWGGRTSMQAGGARAGREIRLEYADALALKEKAKLIEFVSPELMRGGVKAKSAFNASSVGISGVWPVYQFIRTIETDKGRLMSEADNQQARRVAILGYDSYKQLFADRDAIDSQVTLNGLPYTVIGRIRKKAQDSNYAGDDDGRIFIPYEAMRKDFPRPGALDTANTLSTIIVTPYQRVAEQLNEIIEREGKINFEKGGPIENEIRSILAERHGCDPRDPEAFPIWNTAIESVFFSKMIASMNEFFIAVSIVTLMLGGIGVTNIMLISVKERTREIGVRKALGATSRAVQRQFFSEGFLLTLLSGALGLLIGAGLCRIVNLLPMPERFVGMIITWKSASFSIAVLSIIGLVSATYPARRAASLPPVEALRYEA